MTLRLVLRALAARPVRFLVLACGFGFGIAVMAALLGVGEVVLEQAKNPALAGGGDVVLVGGAGQVENARFVLAALAKQVEVASPESRETLYLVQPGEVTALRARAGIPSLERALDDPETSPSSVWSDTAQDLPWTTLDPAEILRDLDGFHPIPDVPARADSWAEWLYFNGRSADGTTRFYLTFLAGPRSKQGMRRCGVRLQLTRDRRNESYVQGAELPEASLPSPSGTLEIAGNRVVLEGLRYTIDLDLVAQEGSRRLRGRIALDAPAGRSVPPFELHGAGGWVSGYVVPVLSGALHGALQVGDTTIALDGALGYHDHNWGFWKDVTWQWGQVAHDDLSFVFGKIHPPPDAADPARVPGVLVALGPEGPLGFARGATIEEEGEPGRSQPRRIVVRASQPDLDLTLALRVDDTTRTAMAGPFGSTSAPMTFLQLRGTYEVRGHVAGRAVDFRAPGSAETFRSD